MAGHSPSAHRCFTAPWTEDSHSGRAVPPGRRLRGAGAEMVRPTSAAQGSRTTVRRADLRGGREVVGGLNRSASRALGHTQAWRARPSQSSSSSPGPCRPGPWPSSCLSWHATASKSCLFVIYLVRIASWILPSTYGLSSIC